MQPSSSCASAADFGKLPRAEGRRGGPDVIAKTGYGRALPAPDRARIDHHGHGDGVNNDDFETRDLRRHLPETCFSIEPGIIWPAVSESAARSTSACRAER